MDLSTSFCQFFIYALLLRTYQRVLLSVCNTHLLQFSYFTRWEALKNSNIGYLNNPCVFGKQITINTSGHSLYMLSCVAFGRTTWMNPDSFDSIYPSYCNLTSILRQGLAPPCDGVGVAAIKASATKMAQKEEPSMLKSPLRGAFIDFGHFWGSHWHQYLPGKVMFGTYMIYMLKPTFHIRHMFHQNGSDHKFSSLQRLYAKKKTHTISQQEQVQVFIQQKQKGMFDHFWRIPIPLFDLASLRSTGSSTLIYRSSCPLQYILQGTHCLAAAPIDKLLFLKPWKHGFSIKT